MQQRVAFVGQAPSRRTDAEGAEPFTGASGRRLAELSGLTHAEFLARYDRFNLFDRWPGPSARGRGDRFSKRDARVAACRLPLHGRERVVVVGLAVAEAFGLRDTNIFTWTWYTSHPKYAIVPHPSGLNRWWNDPANVERARAFLTALATG